MNQHLKNPGLEMESQLQLNIPKACLRLLDDFFGREESRGGFERAKTLQWLGELARNAVCRCNATRRQCAVHEASHAVAFMHEKGFEACTLKINGWKGWAGRTRLWPPPHEYRSGDAPPPHPYPAGRQLCSLEGLLRNARITLAGPCGEWLLAGGSRSGSPGELIEAELCCMLAGASYDQLSDAVESFICKWEEDILRIADALERRKELDDRQVQRLLKKERELRPWEK